MIDETIEQIERMETHSSSIVAIESLRALRAMRGRDFETVEAFIRAVERNSRALRRANPSHPTLFSCQRRVVERLTATDIADVESARQILETAIDEGIGAIRANKRQSAAAAVELLEDGARICTHDYSSTVIDAIGRASEDGIDLEVVVGESRPRCFGRKTARELRSELEIPVTIAVDSAIGSLVADCDLVMTGMTCVVDGTLYNRVGTFPILGAANYHGVPTYAVGSSGKVVPDHFVFENDDRSPIEVLREPIDGVTVENPAYDASPFELLDGIVTEAGLHVPPRHVFDES